MGSARSLGSEHHARPLQAPRSHPMSLFRLLPAWFHAIADYTVAATLILVAAAVGGTGKAVASGVVIGLVVLVVSLLTAYPLGFNSTDHGLTAFYVAAGVAVLAVSLITNYQYSPRRQWAPAAGVQVG